MAVITQEITVEVAKPNYFQALVAKQGDINSRFLKVTFAHDGEKIEIQPTSTARINATRADGEDRAFLGESNSDGTVTVPLASWMLDLPGLLECDVAVIDAEGSKLTSTSFKIMVDKSACMDEVVHEDEYYDILTKVEGILETHTSNKNNPHGLTAEQVGARPNTWMPTASDVGARPVTWMPTASDVGARPVTWMPTHTEVGAAPAGYGIGSNAKLINSFDEIDSAGWYSKWFNADEVPTGATYGQLTFRVSIYGSPTYYEIIMPTGHTYDDYSVLSMIRRRRDGDTWFPWEWENPPMVAGVEYRTTERWNGKPVYRKAYALGTFPVTSRVHNRWYIDKNASIIYVTMHGERHIAEGSVSNGDEQYTGNVFFDPTDNTVTATATPWSNGADWYMDIRTSRDLSHLVNTWGEMRYVKGD